MKKTYCKNLGFNFFFIWELKGSKGHLVDCEEKKKIVEKKRQSTVMIVHRDLLKMMLT